MEARTLAQLEEDCREELDDAVEPYLWSSERLRKLLNEAVAEANLRARLIVDNATPEVCRIALKAGQAEYPLHPSIIVIRRAVLESEPGARLVRTKTHVLDDCQPGWRDSRGNPKYVVREVRNQVIVSPVPQQDDVLLLSVWRNPLETEVMESDGDDPTDMGIEPIWHGYLVHWACYRALTKTDAETETPHGAAHHLQQFELAFGPRPTAAYLENLAIDPMTSTSEWWF